MNFNNNNNNNLFLIGISNDRSGSITSVESSVNQNDSNSFIKFSSTYNFSKLYFIYKS